ncbi:hypothetical protein CHGG_09086 [Chaetomium globosum CBS 148.51]|uniref:BHLH domain-containing protein n=1 Tax=Chaetomium globosum (strain ATCC 6205 / CBS 148.51 / DSM 1962 / NBRC 6347 / NRRL 1970) TaxID=306901 RepID=Q2GSG8_CHAGB|nr:uncharacterized protein CHGG_09086 [Chaetomium globosum CBS 148.51]EAQ85072.1 hypothetical protein CHGG_09086 [Chaetomium globosum CBS 148.51]
MSHDVSSRSNLPAQGIQSRSVLPARGQRSRDGHERKRSRLSLDTNTPLDSVDYWIDFDNDDSLASIPEAFEPRSTAKVKKNKAPMRRPTNLAPSISTARSDEIVDDSALDNALSDEDGFSSVNLTDQLSQINTLPPLEVPPREGLYSTPLSWERPQPGIHMDSPTGPGLSQKEAEQRRLIAIAMNPRSTMGGLGLGAGFDFGGMGAGMPMAFGAGFEIPSISHDPRPVSPPHLSGTQGRPGPSSLPKKRGGVGEKGEKAKEKPKTGERAAHNDIERKYRTNLKDKISELRDAVPALRTILEEGDEDGETQPSRAAKISKGTVFTKAIEYIHFLERQNKQITQEHRNLSRRLQAFEQLLTVTAQQTYGMPAYTSALFDPRGFC